MFEIRVPRHRYGIREGPIGNPEMSNNESIDIGGQASNLLRVRTTIIDQRNNRESRTGKMLTMRHQYLRAEVTNNNILKSEVREQGNKAAMISGFIYECIWKYKCISTEINARTDTRARAPILIYIYFFWAIV